MLKSVEGKFLNSFYHHPHTHRPYPLQLYLPCHSPIARHGIIYRNEASHRTTNHIKQRPLPPINTLTTRHYKIYTLRLINKNGIDSRFCAPPPHICTKEHLVNISTNSNKIRLYTKGGILMPKPNVARVVIAREGFRLYNSKRMKSSREENEREVYEKLNSKQIKGPRKKAKIKY